MTRIIAGFAGSLSLRVPKSGTRPTSDRVREGIFSALDARDILEGAAVLDLYAGSGALGLEAGSRGAAEVVLVERSTDSAAACRHNAKLLATAGGAKAPRVIVNAQSVQAYLDGNAADGALTPFQLVFLDPPYDLSNQELLANLDALGPLLDSGAIVVIERSVRSAAPDLPGRLELNRERRYGETVVYYATARPRTQVR